MKGNRKIVFSMQFLNYDQIYDTYDKKYMIYIYHIIATYHIIYICIIKKYMIYMRNIYSSNIWYRKTQSSRTTRGCFFFRPGASFWSLELHFEAWKQAQRKAAANGKACKWKGLQMERHGNGMDVSCIRSLSCVLDFFQVQFFPCFFCI